jgi:electron transport complex protein RnfA
MNDIRRTILWVIFGFSMVLILFASIRERLEGADVPTLFRGTPIAFMVGGLMSLAFMGFSGLVK